MLEAMETGRGRARSHRPCEQGDHGLGAQRRCARGRRRSCVETAFGTRGRGRAGELRSRPRAFRAATRREVIGTGDEEMDADQLAEVPPSGPTDSPDAGAPMGRRRFLHVAGLGTGTLAVAGAGGLTWRAVDVGVFATGTGAAYAAWDELSPPGGTAMDLVRAAVLAASAHNAQPWRFAVAPDRIDLFATRPAPSARWIRCCARWTCRSAAPSRTSCWPVRRTVWPPSSASGRPHPRRAGRPRADGSGRVAPVRGRHDPAHRPRRLRDRPGGEPAAARRAEHPRAGAGHGAGLVHRRRRQAGLRGPHRPSHQGDHRRRGTECRRLRLVPLRLARDPGAQGRHHDRPVGPDPR